MTTLTALQTDQAGQATPILEQVKDQMGMVPNIFATMAHSPAALEGFLAFSGALAGGSLTPQFREQIALTIAGINSCDYCASAHAVLGKGAGLDDEEVKLSLAGVASDEKKSAVLKFVAEVVSRQGRIDKNEVHTLRVHGFSDAEIVEILANIGLNIFANYFNHVVDTDIDFPFVSSNPLNQPTQSEKIA
ncbi:MAG: carboxymuconolactone decarboxylase family protein [Pseudomonadales bacterium]|nr:carboxymuconolactone decarboxylase family protein [Pseudomonadales bacterium]